MSEFGADTVSHMGWREQHIDRDTSSGVSTEQDAHGHGGHRSSQSNNLYDHYTTPPAASETEEWSASAAHDGHGMIGSPQSSTGSMIDSPQSESRRSVDITAATQSSHSDSQHMSLSERRQEKRKMKRFRLTHNQTRFLMSEFARQAHPDAAHRERLAREIPGLSPRQVQVWFQNRRAKLKRMSSDDRERMMKSRALPEEFPILQTLHTYGVPRMMGTPVASPTEYSPSVGYRQDPLRRRSHLEEEVGVSPTTPAYGLSFASSGPSEMLSPVSTSGERSGYMGGYMPAPLGPQQRGNPFSRTDPYRTHPSVPRLQLHDTPRSLAESSNSPLATSTTYGGHDDYQHSPGGYSLQTMYNNEPPRSVPPDTPSSPYVHSNPGGFTHSYPSPAPASARPPSFPPPLTLSSEFKFSQPPLTPHTGPLSGFATAPLAPAQDYQMPQMSAPADATSFSSSYRDPTTSGRLSLGREFGHQRKRSSSHPPNFPQQREP